MNQTTTQASVTLAFSGPTWPSYVRATISLIGVITNIINMLVFFNDKLKDTSYKFMMAKSAANLSYLGLAFMNEIISYCLNCPWTQSYFALFYQFALGVCVLTCIGLFRILVEIVVSIYTLCILINKPWTKKYAYIWILVALVVVSVLYYAQKPFYYNIVQIPNTSLYTFVPSAVALSVADKTVSIIQTVFRIFLAVFFLSSINIVNLVLFRRRYHSRILLPLRNIQVQSNVNTSVSKAQQKRSDIGNQENVTSQNNTLETSSKSTINITRMVVVSSLIYALGETPSSICLIFFLIGYNTPTFNTIYTYSVFLLYSVPMFDLFIYIFFNRNFRAVVNTYCTNVLRFFTRS